MELEILKKREEDGEKSNRVSPRRHQLKKFEEQGIKIKDCKLPKTKILGKTFPQKMHLNFMPEIHNFFIGYYKVKKEKGDAKVLKLICPFV